MLILYQFLSVTVKRTFEEIFNYIYDFPEITSTSKSEKIYQPLISFNQKNYNLINDVFKQVRLSFICTNISYYYLLSN